MTEFLDTMLPFMSRCACPNTARGLTRFLENLLLCTSTLLSPTTHNTVSKWMPRTHDTLLPFNTNLPAQMVTRQEEVLASLSQLLVVATPEKFALWPCMCGKARAMVGWGPVHLMPALRMLPSPPRRYRLHSAAVPGVLSIDVRSSKQDRRASQPQRLAQQQQQQCRQLVSVSAPGSTQKVMGVTRYTGKPVTAPP
jgi:hypothetical protein